jgi:hypothetical protein
MMSDFSRVRVHHDHHAAESARAIGAHAYTFANHIVFDSDRYTPGKAEGNRLLAHELTHVSKQEASGTPLLQRQSAGEGKEDDERAKILTEFTDGSGLSGRQLTQIKGAMRGFSLHQLREMRKAGVRFWDPDSLPPEFSLNVENLSTPAEYLNIFRVIRMGPNATTDAVRHELAHAWDHVRTGKVKPAGKVSEKTLEKAAKNTPAFSSERNVKISTREISGGKEHPVRLTISEMLDRYRRWRLREQNFDNPSTRESHSKKSVQEFYAEGYSVFHGASEWNQAMLLYYAPELYNMLEDEAKREGLDLPVRSNLEAIIKDQRLPE